MPQQISGNQTQNQLEPIMIDRLFTLTLTLAILAGATLAVSGEFFSTRQSPPAPLVAELPRVVIRGEVQSAQTEVASVQADSKINDAERVQ